MNLRDAVTMNKIDSNQLQRGLVWHFIGLPKRGKTYNASRFCPSMDVEKVLHLDFEHCTLRYPQYKGLNVLPITSYRPPARHKLGADGKPMLDAKKQPIVEAVPHNERGFYVGGEQVNSYSVLEAVQLIKASDKDGSISDFEAIIVDTTDVLQAWGEEDLLKELGVNSLGDIAHGSAWDDARKKVLRPLDEIISVCRKNGIELILLTHSKTTTQIGNRQQRDPALRQGLAIAINGRCDYIGYVDREPTSLTDGSNNGTVADGWQYTVTSLATGEETTGGSRLHKITGKKIPFSYESIKESYEGQ